MAISTQNISEQPHLPGRLGDPEMVLGTDPRTDPRLVTALAEFDMDIAPPPPPVNVDSPLQEIFEYIAEVETGLEEMSTALFSDLPPIENVERYTEAIKGVDNNDITLYIHRPQNAPGPLPCIYHIHGGGMVIQGATDAIFIRWRDELAALGMVVVGVEFRNGAGKLGNHPFPAGLNDCLSGLQWTYENKAALGISRVIVSGQSGGGNLALAVCLKAKKDDKLEQIDGIYAMCPFISNAWGKKSKELPSLYENDGYIFSCRMMGLIPSVYDPEHKNENNPLCWPYLAKKEDLQGLPPHVISVNELDPLRDEGLRYYRMLLAAGVSGYSRTVNGTSHCADQGFRKALPEVFGATIRDIKGFADSL